LPDTAQIVGKELCQLIVNSFVIVRTTRGGHPIT
jgi:hypothetical protein